MTNYTTASDEDRGTHVRRLVAAIIVPVAG